MMTYTIENPMPPLWLMYPYIGQSSAGWRFGYGAEYKWDLTNWLKELSAEDAATWEQMFPPPVFWQEDASAMSGSTAWISVGESEIPIWSNRYNILNLQSKEDSTKEYAFFLLRRDEEKKLPSDCFNRWYESKFSIETREYWCAEQYVLAQKACIFEDAETFKNVLAAKSTHQISDLVRQVKNFDKVKWNQIAIPVLIYANYQKFIQDHSLLKNLLDTGDQILVQASPNDCIWGNGLSEDDPSAKNPNAWRGQNLLGFALMTVREELRRVCANYDKVDWKKIYAKYLK